MKPILIFILGAAAVWLLKNTNDDASDNGSVLPQNQRGISRYAALPTPQQPQFVYASQVTPPFASRQGGYIPAFGPYVDAVVPGDLSWRQA